MFSITLQESLIFCAIPLQARTSASRSVSDTAVACHHRVLSLPQFCVSLYQTLFWALELQQCMQETTMHALTDLPFYGEARWGGSGQDYKAKSGLELKSNSKAFP